MYATKHPGLFDHLRASLPHLRGRLVAQADMRKITWFRTGGLAEVLFQPEDEEDLRYFLQALPVDVPLTIVGIGSNLLVRDGGIAGVVLRLGGKNFSQAHWLSETRLEAGCAISDKKIALLAAQNSVGGFHFYYGIPGALGGALRMNAGANGVDTSARFVSLRAMDRQGQIHVFSLQDMAYSYRHCGVPVEYIFLSAILEGFAQDKALIEKEIAEVARHREEVQPVRERTGGSTFRNPTPHSAWQLIDQAGCRGFAINDAQMSEMHCNFLINKSQACAYDLELLGETVRQKVYEKSGILLEWEIARIGQFEENKRVLSFKPC